MKKIIILSFIILIIIILSLIFFKFLFKNIKTLLLKKNIRNLTINSIDALNGYDFELFISILFKSFNYKTQTTKKSGDKGADIIAKKKNIKIAIQAKLYYKNKVGTHAIQEIFSAQKFYNCNKSIVITNNYFTNQAIELATNLNVILIDRNKLINLIKSKDESYLNSIILK